MEDLKRISFRFQNLKMQVLSEVSVSDNIYLVSVSCRAYEIDGIIEKLNLEDGISWARSSD